MLIWFLASSNNDVDLSNIWLPLAAAAGVATGLWLVSLLAFAVATRPREIPAAEPTMDLGEEPPAVVDYLFNHYESSANGISGTLLDLAARHYLAIEDREDETVCHLGNAPPAGLLPYEKMLYDHVTALAAAGPVPAQALTTGATAQSASWQRRFEDLVAQDAKSRGLVEPRWGLKEWGISRVIGLVAGILAIATAAQANAVEFGIGGAIAVAVGAHSALQKVFGTQKLTPKGETVVSHWLGVRAFMNQGEGFHDLPAGHVILWDRYMAYAGALGLARTALRSLPMGVEDDHKAWSNITGDWRQVTVRYPRTRFVWGRSPAGVLLVGLVTAALGSGGIYAAFKLYDFAEGFTSTDQSASIVGQFALGFGALGAFVVFWGITTLNLAFIDLGDKRELRGRVVRCRSYSRGNNNGLDYFVAVDDGSQDRIKAWLVTSAVYHAAREGAVVSAIVSRRQGYVFKMTTEQAAPEPEVPVQASPEATVADLQVPQLLRTLAAAQAAGGALLDPATLLTPEEVAAAVGEPMNPPGAMPGAPQRTPMRAVHFAAPSGHASVSVVVASRAFAPLLGVVTGKMGKDVDVAGAPAVIRGDTIIMPRADAIIAIRIERVAKADKETALRQLAMAASQHLVAASPATSA